MLKFAITGNIASGKSVAEKFLSERGYIVFDTDKIAHEILETSEDVKTMFSDEDIFTDSKVDRKKLGRVVFSDKEKIKKL